MTRRTFGSALVPMHHFQGHANGLGIPKHFYFTFSEYQVALGQVFIRCAHVFHVHAFGY